LNTKTKARKTIWQTNYKQFGGIFNQFKLTISTNFFRITEKYIYSGNTFDEMRKLSCMPFESCSMGSWNFNATSLDLMTLLSTFPYANGFEIVGGGGLEKGYLDGGQQW